MRRVAWNAFQDVSYRCCFTCNAQSAKSCMTYVSFSVLFFMLRMLCVSWSSLCGTCDSVYVARYMSQVRYTPNIDIDKQRPRQRHWCIHRHVQVHVHVRSLIHAISNVHSHIHVCIHLHIHLHRVTRDTSTTHDIKGAKYISHHQPQVTRNT